MTAALAVGAELSPGDGATGRDVDTGRLVLPHRRGRPARRTRGTAGKTGFEGGQANSDAHRPDDLQGQNPGQPPGPRQAHHRGRRPSCRIVSDPPLLVPTEELFSRETERRASATRSTSSYAVTATASRPTGGTCWRSSSSSRSPAKSSAWAAWAPGLGSCSSWAGTTMTHSSSRPRRRKHRCSRSSWARAASPITASGWWPASTSCRRPATSSSDTSRSRVLDGVTRDFYLRQLRDWKGSFDIEGSIPPGLTKYGAVCAQALARAHARSGDRIAIASYLGAGPPSTGPLPNSPRPMPTRTRGTTRRSRRRRPVAGYASSQAFRPPGSPPARLDKRPDSHVLEGQTRVRWCAPSFVESDYWTLMPLSR